MISSTLEIFRKLINKHIFSFKQVSEKLDKYSLLVLVVLGCNTIFKNISM